MPILVYGPGKNPISGDYSQNSDACIVFICKNKYLKIWKTFPFFYGR